jgi:hypothetical protein
MSLEGEKADEDKEYAGGGEEEEGKGQIGEVEKDQAGSGAEVDMGLEAVRDEDDDRDEAEMMAWGGRQKKIREKAGRNKSIRRN